MKSLPVITVTEEQRRKFVQMGSCISTSLTRKERSLGDTVITSPNFGVRREHTDRAERGCEYIVDQPHRDGYSFFSKCDERGI